LLALMPSHSPNADLDQALGRALFHDAGEGTGMRQAVTFQFVVEIRMGVEVKDG
jgi:hypothetical protein